MKLFLKYKIGNKLPDALILDKEEKDHKIIFYQKPKILATYATPDILREVGKYYMKQSKGEFIPCYPVLVEMWEYKYLFSKDGDGADIWIGPLKQIQLQQKLALKKTEKWEYLSYKELKKDTKKRISIQINLLKTKG